MWPSAFSPTQEMYLLRSADDLPKRRHIASAEASVGAWLTASKLLPLRLPVAGDWHKLLRLRERPFWSLAFFTKKDNRVDANYTS